MKATNYVDYVVLNTKVIAAVDNVVFTIGLTTKQKEMTTLDIMEYLAKDNKGVGIQYCLRTTTNPHCGMLCSLDDAVKYINSLVFHTTREILKPVNTTVIPLSEFNKRGINVINKDDCVIFVVGGYITNADVYEERSRVEYIMSQLPSSVVLEYGKTRAELLPGVKPNEYVSIKLDYGNLMIIQMKPESVLQEIEF